MKFLVLAGTLVLVIGLFSYLVLPGLIEDRLAGNLRQGYGLDEEPSVEVSSGFPPELLLGRIDRIEVRIDRLTREGILLRDLQIDLEAVDVSVSSLFSGDLEREIRAGSLVAEVPEESINDYLRENDMGLEGGEIDVRQREVVYRSEDVFLGLPGSVSLDLRVVGPHTMEVVPQEATVAGFPLPPFLTEPLTSGGRTLDLGELPFGAELTSVEPSPEDALAVWAEK